MTFFFWLWLVRQKQKTNQPTTTKNPQILSKSFLLYSPQLASVVLGEQCSWFLNSFSNFQSAIMIRPADPCAFQFFQRFLHLFFVNGVFQYRDFLSNWKSHPNNFPLCFFCCCLGERVGFFKCYFILKEFSNSDSFESLSFFCIYSWICLICYLCLNPKIYILPVFLILGFNSSQAVNKG